MDEAPENGKELSNSAHASGINEMNGEGRGRGIKAPSFSRNVFFVMVGL